MPRDDLENWMFAEAVEMLSRAERMHRRFFQPLPPAAAAPAWEPPVDVLETEREVLVFAALPGVDPDQVETRIEEGPGAINPSFFALAEMWARKRAAG